MAAKTQHGSPRDPSQEAEERQRDELRQLIAIGETERVCEIVQRLVGERYRIDQLAGSGGMGCVLSALDTVLQRRVAIKVLIISDATASHPLAGRILAEARAMAGLRHPNICPVHEVSVTGPIPHIVMDWIDGIDLESAWREAELNHRLALFVKIVEAVAVAHVSGVVHADIKPSNILVDRKGEPIIFDFGLARMMFESPTRRFPLGGTPGYAAPEQFDTDRPIGPAVDVYALGAMMYEMLADRLPFAAETPLARMQAAREQEPPLPESYAPGAPWPLQRICLVALEREPERRYPDAHAMAVDLRRYLKGESVAARPSMLTEQFFEKVEQQIEQVDAWLRQDAVTESEANTLMRALGGLLRPESHWILDSRRLTISQVTLYLGGWFALIALAIGLTFTGSLGGYFPSDALARYPSLRYITAWVVVIVLVGAGWFIQRRGQRRISLGYLVTSCMAVPVAVWLLLRESGWLGEPMVTTFEVVGPGAMRTVERSREWLKVILGVDPADIKGLLNRQVLVILLAWFGVAAGLRRLSGSSAFTPFAVVAAALAAVAAWASAGLLSDETRGFALLGLWVLAVGLAAVWPGLHLNTWEERQVRQHGRRRARTGDSWPVLTVSLVMIGLGLTLMAWNAADLYTLGLLYDDSADPSARAVAFIMNGVLLQALSHLLARRRTVSRGRLAEAIRWISPSHFLAGLLVLQIDAQDGWWLFWLIVLSAASIGTCYLSVWKQWRPFLFSGLFYLAVAYERSFVEAVDRMTSEAALDKSRIMLAGTMLLLGMLTMILAWKLPDWLASLKLERWSRD